MKKTYGPPVLIPSNGAAWPLERIALGAGTYSEDWLQKLIFDYPETLPVHDIEPGFGDIISIAREVPCGHGYIDNLYLTPAGDIVMVETKLWRNGEARREVVAQTLDYVAALTRMDYAGLENAVRHSLRAAGAPDQLYGHIVDQADAAEEARFIDAVALNLKRGRMLVLVVGDGIRQEAEALGSLLQSHAGAHFTFAMVELATWRDPTTGATIILPGTLAQTVMIERGIVVIANNEALILPVPARTQAQAKAHSISETMMLEELAAIDPALPKAIEDFLTLVEPLAVYPEYKASLNLKVQLPDAIKPIGLGYIQRNGQLWTDTITSGAPPDLARTYLETLAALTGGSIADTARPYVTTNGKSAPRINQLLPQHAEAWAKAIETLLVGIGQRAGTAA